MPKSSPSPTITPMNPTLPKPPPPHSQTLTLTHPLADDHHHFIHSYNRSLFMVDDYPSSSAAAPLIFPQVDEDDDVDEEEEEEEEEEDGDGKPLNPNPNLLLLPAVDPTPHLSSQFYTFNRDSHSLMARCILESRLASPDEIRAATPRPVLASWRSVWKDRNEDTAYLTAWKRIQDKLHAHLDPSTSVPHLYFKNNPSQRVPHVAQWHDIVARAHADPDLLRHLALKETVERIRQSWTVGAKLYGIPESFVRVCVSSCPVCSGPAPVPEAAARSKRRRFEYTESMEVPARDVPRRLQQLAAKHQVVLCIRQKYIRYKPFMAEVKDYACHRAGEPSSGSSAKKTRLLKREPYQSKRCGCGFRIRAIVPITNYSEKDKTFVYKEEGNAVFKLYAVHSGHEPGPLDGNARIIHRMVGNKGRFDVDPVIYGVREEATEPESYVNLMAKDDGGGDADLNVLLQQVQDLRIETELLEEKIARTPQEIHGQISCELAGILHRLRSIGGPQHLEAAALVVGDNEVGQWREDDNQNHHLDGHDSRMFVKDPEIIEEEENDFGSALGTIVPWGRMETECHGRKMLIAESCKPDDKWLKEDCGDFDEKSILNCGDEEDSKLIKPMRHDVTIVTDSNLVGMQVDGFYHDSTKWYDSPGSLDGVVDSGDCGFRHGGLP